MAPADGFGARDGGAARVAGAGRVSRRHAPVPNRRGGGLHGGGSAETYGACGPLRRAPRPRPRLAPQRPYAPGARGWGAPRPAHSQADAERPRLIPALRFMQQEFHRGPTLVDIARTVELSPFHFHRRFSELLGLTPKQFLLDCQIHLAKADLLSGA